MRICLITPPSLFLTTERCFMSLGILRVAAVLEQVGHTVDFLDLSGVENYLDVVEDYLEDHGGSVFGLSATTPQGPVAISISKFIRARRPGAKVILGGAHVTAVHAAYKLESGKGRATKAMDKLRGLFDVLIAGDGEKAVLRALEENSPTLLDADDQDSELFLKEWEIDKLPLPARHLVDVSSYHYMIDGEKSLSLVAQQGCPFHCGFCGGRSSPSMCRVRARSVDNTLDEIVHLYRAYGVRGFMIYDDELNLNNQRLLDLGVCLRGLQKLLGQEFRFRGFVRANLFTEEQAQIMYEAGFRWVIVGFESGSPRMLENMEKQASVDDNTRCMEIAQRCGLKVKAAMSIGHPGETAETIEQTKNWLLQVAPDSVDVSIITPYPGSLYYGRAIEGKNGVWCYTSRKHLEDRLYMHDVDYTVTDVYYKGVPGAYESYVYTDGLGAGDLIRLRDEVARVTQEALGLPDLEMGFQRYDRTLGRLPSNIYRTSGMET